MIVYKHTAPNGKVYIGCTSTSLERRKKSGYGGSFGKAIQKFGWKNIKSEILFEDLTKEEAYAKEVEMIEKYQSTNPEFGYNISIGGAGSPGCIRSEETKKKISIHNAWKGTHGPMYGKHASEETRKKMSKSLKGKKALVIEGKTLEQWSEIIGIKAHTIYVRIYVYKWPLQKALQKG